MTDRLAALERVAELSQAFVTATNLRLVGVQGSHERFQHSRADLVTALEALSSAAPQPDRLAALELVARWAQWWLSIYCLRQEGTITDPAPILDTLDTALSSTAPAPCPRCKGTKEIGWTEYTPGGHPVSVVDNCPRCSAQPATSDVVVPRDVAQEYVEACAGVNKPASNEGDSREAADRLYDAQEALKKALAAALRQGGG